MWERFSSSSLCPINLDALLVMKIHTAAKGDENDNGGFLRASCGVYVTSVTPKNKWRGETLSGGGTFFSIISVIYCIVIIRVGVITPMKSENFVR